MVIRSALKKIGGMLLITLMLAVTAAGQSNKASDAQKKKARIERSYKKAYAKARKRTIKHRREIQTDETKKRMDAADDRANAYNNQNNPGFFDRLFKRKRPRKR